MVVSKSYRGNITMWDIWNGLEIFYLAWHTDLGIAVVAFKSWRVRVSCEGTLTDSPPCVWMLFGDPESLERFGQHSLNLGQARAEEERGKSSAGSAGRGMNTDVGVAHGSQRWTERTWVTWRRGTFGEGFPSLPEVLLLGCVMRWAVSQTVVVFNRPFVYQRLDEGLLNSFSTTLLHFVQWRCTTSRFSSLS